MSVAPSCLMIIRRPEGTFIRPECDECPDYRGGLFADGDLAGAVAQANFHDLKVHHDFSSLRRP